MNKIHEEHWHIVDDDKLLSDSGPHQPFAWFVRFDGRQVERVKLAAVAPRLARTLLMIEWRARHAGQPASCVFCLRTQVDGHDDGCIVDGTLREAGLK